MPSRLPNRRSTLQALAAASALLLGSPAFAAEHVTLSNGFELTCDHRADAGAKTRLYLDATASNYVEVVTADITADDPLPATAAAQPHSLVEAVAVPTPAAEVLSAPELHQLLQGAGATHDLDVDLLASVVHAESNNHVHARSRVGAQGLMQLMPGTAAQLGVHDAFAPADNVGGGAAYLDSLLRRYHNNLAYALAAYNAGPGAVDRWHGVPPYRETRAYVARIIRDFNQRYAARARNAEALASITRP